MTAENLNTAKRLYRALAAHDRDALMEMLSETFRGRVSEGMPDGLGGLYEGANAMLNDCWGPLFAAFDVQPVPEEFLSRARRLHSRNRPLHRHRPRQRARALGGLRPRPPFRRPLRQ